MTGPLLPIMHHAIISQCARASGYLMTARDIENHALELHELSHAGCTCGQCPPLTPDDERYRRALLTLLHSAAEFKAAFVEWNRLYMKEDPKKT